MRAVDAVQIAEAAPREFEQVPSLAAAEVQYAAIGRDVHEFEERFDLGLGDIRVLDDVTVRAQVVRIENVPPPVSLDIALEVFDGADGTPYDRLALRLRSCSSGLQSLFWHVLFLQTQVESRELSAPIRGLSREKYGFPGAPFGTRSGRRRVFAAT